ncbi:MAG: hypothetical protein H6625_05380 [Bdellovibrionaceae bacterium]|nr:hypothetical protein [Pseudobdellovibrionaceae bacterium]
MSNKNQNFMSQICYSDKLPPVKLFGSQALLIYDKKLDKVSTDFTNWTKDFGAIYPVSAGERLKSVETFSKHINKILKLVDAFSVKEMLILVVGGGSLGDFGGFVASVLKRGVRLIHMPSTWLAAIDSSHGGKTALNVGNTKNQIGSFYPAESVYLCKQLLIGQPNLRAQEAMGELVKIALLDNNEWNKKLVKSDLPLNEMLWEFLDKAVKAKYKVVKKDPKEKSGYRGILNLGHSLGHVIESYYGLSHGMSVGLGLYFAVDWSFEKKFLPNKDYLEIKKILETLLPIKSLRVKLKPIGREDFLRLVLRDKKRETKKTIQFIFLKGIGKPLINRVSISDFYKFARKTKWVK